jgi:transcriptional regulator with XRE-family HTH domain
MPPRTAPRRSRSAGRGPLGDLGRAAAERRRELGLTQRELAALAAVSERSVQSLEAGKLSLRADVLTKILSALGLVLVAVPTSQAQRLRHAGGVPVRERAADAGGGA